MRFLLLTFAGASSDFMPSDARTVDAVDRFNRALREAGVLLGTDRLRPAADHAHPPVAVCHIATRVAASAYWLIQVRTIDEALAWAQRCPLAPDETLAIRLAIPHGASA